MFTIAYSFKEETPVNRDMGTTLIVEENDSDLVQRTLCGDWSAYDQLVKRYQRQIYNFAYRMMGNAEDAQDVSQETFLRAFQALSTFRKDASFLTWLFKIASNLCIDQLRARKSKGTISLDNELEEGREPAADARSSDPEDVVIRGAVQDIVQHAINTLPARYRAVVVLRHLQGMSVEEIAKALELPPGTVKTHLFRAREMLRDRLATALEIK